MTGTKVGGGYDRPSTCALCLSEDGDGERDTFWTRERKGPRSLEDLPCVRHCAGCLYLVSFSLPAPIL